MVVSPEPSGRWTYRAAASDDATEFGTVTGRDVALPPHFHDEDQITFVLSGRRRFLLRGATETRGETVEAGRGFLIPARSVHRSLLESDGVACLNLYVPAGEFAVDAMLAEAEGLWRKAGRLEHGDLSKVVAAHRLGWTDVPSTGVLSRRSVAERAKRSGLSREGFTRAFARRHGMSPHAFDLMERLNQARRRLRLEAPLAAVAFEAGFADQSHLGRCFRAAFGVTPGQFRRGQVTNVPDATRSGP